MPGRRSSAGRARRIRSHSLSHIQWRHASTTQVAETGGLSVAGGNGFIDQYAAIKKLKLHGVGLWGMQAVVALVMSVIAVVADTRYGLTYWYTNTSAGGKLRNMQYAWAFFNTLCAVYGVWVYLLWNEAMVDVHRDRRLFRQKSHIWLSYFTWAFGIWTSAVVIMSFKNYSFSGNYPTDLTCAFAGALTCCLFSDLWALGKLCSLGTYTAWLEEEWRLSPYEPSAPPLSVVLQPDLEQAVPHDTHDDIGGPAELERRRSPEDGESKKIFKFARRRSSAAETETLPNQAEESTGDPESGQGSMGGSSFGIAFSEDEVLLPHAFERLWGALATQGDFQTRILEAVPQDTVVQHLTERGFQVVAAGTSDGLMRVLFCAKEATNNGTGAWFLAELLQDEGALTLEAKFKSKRPDVVTGFVQSFMLHRIFTMAKD